MARQPRLPTEAVERPGFWCLTQPLAVWTPTIRIESTSGVVGVVAGHPLLNENGSALHDLETLVLEVGQGRDQALAQARGSFCLATWNPIRRELALATDHLSNRCLYHRVDGPWIHFATSLRLLRGMLDAAAEDAGRSAGENVDEAGLAESIYFGQPLGRRTMFEGISVLRPGEVVRITPERRTQKFHVDHRTAQRSRVTLQQASDTLHQVFRAAVARRTTPGIQEAFLSGGMDSRAVVAQLVDMGENVRSFCAAYPDSMDERISALVAAKLGTEHHTWTRGAEERLLYTLDPFAMYARRHFPLGKGPWPRALWSGDGGSVTLGHVYMDATRVALAAGEVNESLIRRLFPSINGPLSRQIDPRLATKLADMAMAGAMQELRECSVAEPDRRLFHFYMRNDQARHLHHHYESIDVSGIELLTPFFDREFVAAVCALPCEHFLGHRLYNDWIQAFRCGAGELHWQPYPGHLPCPHPLPEDAVDQWDRRWFETPSVRRAYSRLAASLAAERAPNAEPYVKKGLLRLLSYGNRIGVSRYNYEIEFARNILGALRAPKP